MTEEQPIKILAETKRVIFMPGNTIEAMIKRENNYNLSNSQLAQLMIKYNELNGMNVPRVGNSAEIPILDRNTAE